MSSLELASGLSQMLAVAQMLRKLTNLRHETVLTHSMSSQSKSSVKCCLLSGFRNVTCDPAD